jgi:hypothetical protein
VKGWRGYLVKKSQTRDISDYISGGYYLVQRTPLPKNISELLPDKVLTVSDCFAKVAPDLWAVDWEDWTEQDRADEAAAFGISAQVVADLVLWFSVETGSDHPNAFSSLALAREFYRRFVTVDQPLIVGIGLHKTLLSSFHEQLSKDSNRGYGLVERVLRYQPIADGGRFLGYEPLGYEATHFHTWLCHHAPDEAHARFKTLPNENGLISTLEEAIQVTRYLTDTGAEPAIWEPWLVTEYAPAESTTEN